ncbi:MAG: translocation/assembly module TamB domain-containing protein [Chitinophagaceae bacterium]|nr:translocation/assembly module TamB domain-containing protein [Oligoflexus sp.]
MLFKHLFKASAYGVIMLIEFMTLLVIIAAFLAGILLYRPQWIINDKNVRTVSKYVLPHFGVTLDFKKFEAEFPQTNIYERGIGLTFEKLRVKTDTMTFIAPNFGFAAGFNLHPDHMGLTMVGPVVIEEGVFALNLPPIDPYAQEEPFQWDDTILKKIRAIKWEMVSAHFKEINIERDHATLLKGPASLDVFNHARVWTLNFDSGTLVGTPVLKSHVKADVKLPTDIAASFPSDVKLSGDVSLQDQGPVTLDGLVTILDLDDIHYRLSGSYGAAPHKIQAKLSGFFDHGKFLSQIEGRADGLVEQLPQLALKKCRLEGHYNLHGPEIINSVNSCEVFIERKPMAEELDFADLSPTVFTVKLQAPLKLTLKDNQTYLEAGNVKASINPIANGVYKLRASLVGNFEGYLSASPSTIKSEIKIDSEIEIPEFKRLVERLEPTPFAIPAPLHTLVGRVACGTQGRVVNLGEQLDIPLQCNTVLKSSVQALSMDVNGVIQTWLNRKPKLKLDVLFKDVAFELPKMRIEDPIPQFTPDARLQDKLTEEPPQKISDKVLPLELDITIKTAKPALLQTHVLKGEPVPVDVDVHVTGDKAQVAGQVSVKNYTVDFLKRKALVDHIVVTLDPTQESPALDGLFLFEETDFKISLILKGTSDQPFYYLESEPPRTPTELLSILMYGGDADALDTEGQRSVEETHAAMVDGALGLLSMYYLASTPIDSVGYNPYTGVFRARVKLAKGLTLAVGSDLGGSRQSVGIRKRISENWSFETTAETDETTQVAKGVALFKWGKRY